MSMTVERLRSLMPVYQAILDGKTVQWRGSLGRTGRLSWFEADSGVFTFESDAEWRIKPTPAKESVAFFKGPNPLVAGTAFLVKKSTFDKSDSGYSLCRQISPWTEITLNEGETI